MKVLVTGGAGYVGSPTCKALAKRGITPVAFDNLSIGHDWAVQWGPFYKGDIHETEKLTDILKNEDIQAVFHFAAFAEVGESVQNPFKYYHNNVLGTMQLLSAMKRARVRKFIFSSTCATYGVPAQLPISEEQAQVPINPYGQSKLMVEQILSDLVKAGDLSVTALRYFNASGADVDCEIGEDHEPESHLIPVALDAAFQRRPHLTIFGEDYETKDGTCIRDYVHVTDLAEAHILAYEKMSAPAFQFYNLGTGHGSSVREIVHMVEKITQRKVPIQIGPRRAGDPAKLVASGEKAKKELGWWPQHSSLENVIATAARWHESHFIKT